MRNRVLVAEQGLVGVPRTSPREEEARTMARARIRDVEFAWATFLVRGMEQGILPEADPRLLTRALLGLYNSIWHWYRPRGSVSLDEVREFFLRRQLAVLGLPPELADGDRSLRPAVAGNAGSPSRGTRGTRSARATRRPAVGLASRRSVARRLASRRLGRQRERFPAHALEIPEVGQVAVPLGVRRIVRGEPGGVGVGIEQLVTQGHEGGDPRFARVGGRPRRAAQRPGRQEPHVAHAASDAAPGRGRLRGGLTDGWVASTNGTTGADGSRAWPEIVAPWRGTTRG